MQIILGILVTCEIGAAVKAGRLEIECLYLLDIVDIVDIDILDIGDIVDIVDRC